MSIKTYRKPNGDLNLDIESVVEVYPEIAGSKCDDAEQKEISVALIPYLIEEMKRTSSSDSQARLLQYKFNILVISLIILSSIINGLFL